MRPDYPLENKGWGWTSSQSHRLPSKVVPSRILDDESGREQLLGLLVQRRMVRRRSFHLSADAACMCAEDTVCSGAQRSAALFLPSHPRALIVMGRPPRRGLQVGIVGGYLGLIGVSTLAFVLRAPSFLLLRRIELVLLGLASFVVCNWSFGCFSNGVSIPAALSHDIDKRLASVYWIVSADRFTHFRLSPAMISFPAANFLSLIVSIYGVILPQTPRRIICIILAMMLAMAAMIWAAAAANPDLRPYLARTIVASCSVIIAGGGICAYIGLKFQALRRAIFDAKQVGQYRLTRLLGRGAMGEVYLGQHPLLRRLCAVKLIRASQAGSEEALVRFERETLAELYAAHLYAVPDLHEQLRELPPELASVIERCLAKAPGDRYQDVEAVAAALSATACAGDWSRAQARAFWQLHAAKADPAELTA